MKFRRITALILAMVLCLSMAVPVFADDAKYEAAVADIISLIPAGAADWQKALIVHDAIVQRSEYDQTLTRYSAYDLLVYGTAVCEGYARAYMDIMTRLGVPCRLVTSNAMNHAWNIVQIGGSWYHVDATWDDPLYYNNDKLTDVRGSVLHQNFLLSDAGISAVGHHDWYAAYACADSRYDSGTLWADQESAIIFPNADSCYIRRGTYSGMKLMLRDLASGTERPVFSDYTYASWNYSCGLSLDGGKLYISSKNGVYAVDPATGASERVYTGTDHIWGSDVRDGLLRMTVQQSDGYYRQDEVRLYTPEEPEKNTIKLTIGQPKMLVNASPTDIDTQGTVPVIIDGRTLLPLRAVMEAMGCEVGWDNASKTVSISRDGVTLWLQIGSLTASDSRGEGYVLDCAPALMNGRTMLPIRFAAEYFGGSVSWDNATKTVTVEY